jgi:hypothetical protein
MLRGLPFRNEVAGGLGTQEGLLRWLLLRLPTPPLLGCLLLLRLLLFVLEQRQSFGNTYCMHMHTHVYLTNW